ncbi:type II secretion system protein E [Salinarchaeum sp. Harcht-Bsk1]|uniref:type II/IV secretion system ATPase subunit n=1 Tax=Salinarchaeum sp. Harcht-Bsk1 TaxID=1333523 RepID=UPI0003424177|nr:ATPase, T2SS/T4P/T4SS family [Salinarchaeum sp. Harcht-Bsk1]AGN02610.1 type II secretion system protein E [Salinarchaeum sp. Harcht-Bsk1]
MAGTPDHPESAPDEARAEQRDAASDRGAQRGAAADHGGSDTTVTTAEEPPQSNDTSSLTGEFEASFAYVRRQLLRAGQLLQGSTIPTDEYSPSEHGPLVSFDGLDGYEEVDRYWVNAPFAFVSINYDDAANEYRYEIVEPELTDDEFALLETAIEDVRDPLIYRTDIDVDDAETVLRDELREQLEQYGADLSVGSFHKLLYYVYRAFRGYGKIDPILHDPHIEDISCDGYDLPIFVYHDDYTDVESSVSFAKEELDNFVVRLAQQSGRHISIGDPMVQTTLPDGSRVEMALGEEVTPRGSAFTIRKYAEDPFTPIDLLNYGTFNVEQMAYLWLAIEHNKSLIFAGGTASGKTTSMNAISMFIPPRSKVLTIEDTRELTLYHDNWLSNVTRERLHEGTDIEMYDLLRSALRHRPEYIIVGEVRGDEAITLFQAMNTGHTTYSTMHADSVQTVINRLENEPINVPRSMVQSLDVLCVQTLTRFEDERVRRNKTVAEIEGIDQRTGELDYSTAYRWDADDDSFSGSGSAVMGEIREERGWTQSEYLSERRDRQQFLEYLRDNDVTDYRQFTALVNEYYADKDAVMERVSGTGDHPVPDA